MGETSLIVGTFFLQVDNARPKRPLIADVAGFFNDALLDDTLEKLHIAFWVTAVLLIILSSELECRDNGHISFGKSSPLRYLFIPFSLPRLLDPFSPRMYLIPR